MKKATKSDVSRRVRYELSREKIEARLDKIHDLLDEIDTGEMSPMCVEDKLSDARDKIMDLAGNIYDEKSGTLGLGGKRAKKYAHSRDLIIGELSMLIEQIESLNSYDKTPDQMNDQISEHQTKLENLKDKLEA